MQRFGLHSGLLTRSPKKLLPKNPCAGQSRIIEANVLYHSRVRFQAARGFRAHMGISDQVHAGRTTNSGVWTNFRMADEIGGRGRRVTGAPMPILTGKPEAIGPDSQSQLLVCRPTTRRLYRPRYLLRIGTKFYAAAFTPHVATPWGQSTARVVLESMSRLDPALPWRAQRPLTPADREALPQTR